MKYTLEQLAHFDRCLFPKDFKEDLIEAGLSEGKAELVEDALRWSKNTKGIVQIYQDWHNIPEVVDAIKIVLNKFVEKYP